MSQQPIHRPAATMNPLAVVAFCCALALPLMVLWVPGLVLGHIALHQINRDPTQRGRGLAVTAIVIGWVIIGLIALFSFGALVGGL